MTSYIRLAIIEKLWTDRLQIYKSNIRVKNTLPIEIHRYENFVRLLSKCSIHISTRFDIQNEIKKNTNKEFGS